MSHDKATLIADVKALEHKLELAKQQTKAAQEHYEAARKQLIDAQQTADEHCENIFQENMAQITALRKHISQTHFDTQQQLCQLRQELASTYGKLYKATDSGHHE